MSKVDTTTANTTSTSAAAPQARASPTTNKVADQEPKEGICCCPEFTPESIAAHDEKTITFENKSFVKERAWCFYYMPLNFGQAMSRACAKISKAEAKCDRDDMLLLSDMCSPWSTRLYLSVTKDEVPGAEVVHVSGKYLTKVFEGPYNNFGQWIEEMKTFVKKEKGKDFTISGGDMYTFYTTCPGCAKQYGKNYTVLYAKVEEE